MRWKLLFAILLGLLMVGVTTKNSASTKVENVPQLEVLVGVQGIYDSNPKLKIKDTSAPHLDTVMGFIKVTRNDLSLLILTKNRIITTKKRISLFRSKYFDGYVILLKNSKTDRILALQGNVYTNGTIEVILKDKNGGAYVLKSNNKKLVKILKSMRLPQIELGKYDWLLLVVTPKVEILNSSRLQYIQDSSGTHSVLVSNDEILIVKATWINLYKEQWYIQVRSIFEGPTNFDFYGQYKAAIEVVDEGKYIDRRTSFVLKSMGTPIEAGTICTCCKDPIQIGLTTPWTSTIHDRIWSIYGPVYYYKNGRNTNPPWGFYVAFDLLTWYLDIPNPISLLDLTNSKYTNTFPIPPGKEANSFKLSLNGIELENPRDMVSIEGITIEHQDGSGGSLPVYS